MAGSYNHITTNKGQLRSNESFVSMIENLGDAYEAVEELYGMIWYLAAQNPGAVNPAKAVERARNNYKHGLKLSKEHAEAKPRS